MEDRIKTLRLHFIYCSVILVLIIIAIATDRWTLQPKFTEYLSNAATMTSLMLGLVAIFYSFVSNDGLSKSLGSISTVSDEVRQSKEQIARYIDLTQGTAELTERSADLIATASTEVNSNLSALTQTLSAIREHTEVLHGSLGNLPTRLDELETKVIDATKSLGEKTQVLSPVTRTNFANSIEPALAKRFLDLSSLSSNLLVYACVLAKATGKDLVISDFCAAIDSKVEAYMSGFLSCMNAMELVTIDDVPGKSRTFKIESIHPTLDTTKQYFIGFLESYYKDQPEPLSRWQTALNNVEALFA